MDIVTDPSRLQELISSRFSDRLELPDTFRSETPFPIRPGESYTVQESFQVDGIATFENTACEIQIRPAAGNRSSFRSPNDNKELDASYCQKGQHNIQLGAIKIIEHPLALMLAYQMFLDFENTQDSFPTFDDCDRQYVNGLQNNSRLFQKTKSITVQDPIGIVWENGGYCILEPDEGAKKLILDHQISYPGKTLGNQRVVWEFTPELFTFLADARTTAFRPQKEAEQFYQLGLAGGLKDYPLNLNNVILLDENKIYNPYPKYDTPSGNLEFMCHEIIDIVAWLRFIEEKNHSRFVGKMTTYLFDHHKQIDIAQEFCSPKNESLFSLE